MIFVTWHRRLFAAVLVIAGVLLSGCEINSPYLDEIEQKIAADLIPAGDGPTVIRSL
jgi:hypothetical protein